MSPSLVRYGPADKSCGHSRLPDGAALVHGPAREYGQSTLPAPVTSAKTVPRNEAEDVPREGDYLEESSCSPPPTVLLGSGRHGHVGGPCVCPGGGSLEGTSGPRMPLGCQLGLDIRAAYRSTYS